MTAGTTSLQQPLRQPSGSVQGLFAQFGWNGLTLNYGYFWTHDFKASANDSTAQAFRVGYTFTF